MPHDSRLTGHMPPLDGVRGVAILSVMLLHTAAPLPLPPALALVVGFGWAGVDLFFALSGFLITGILLDTRERPDYYRRFYARRTRRIVPLYGLYVLVLALAVPGDWVPWYATWTMNLRVALANGWSASVAGTAFFWSLCVEEQFYALWPSVVRRMTGRTLVQGAAVLAVLALGFRVWMVSSGHLFAAYVLLPSRMDGLALGAAAAVLVRREGGLDRLARLAPAVLGVAALGLVALVLRTHYAGWDSAWMATVGYSLTAFGATAVVVRAVSSRPGETIYRLITLRPLRYAGRRAYGLYVLSGLAALLATGITTRPAMTALVEVGFAVVLAELSWRLIERPALTGRFRLPFLERADAA